VCDQRNTRLTTRLKKPKGPAEKQGLLYHPACSAISACRNLRKKYSVLLISSFVFISIRLMQGLSLIPAFAALNDPYEFKLATIRTVGLSYCTTMGV
jgi:hypothetical protein